MPSNVGETQCAHAIGFAARLALDGRVTERHIIRPLEAVKRDAMRISIVDELAVVGARKEGRAERDRVVAVGRNCEFDADALPAQ